MHNTLRLQRPHCSIVVPHRRTEFLVLFLTLKYDSIASARKNELSELIQECDPILQRTFSRLPQGSRRFLDDDLLSSIFQAGCLSWTDTLLFGISLCRSRQRSVEESSAATLRLRMRQAELMLYTSNLLRGVLVDCESTIDHKIVTDNQGHSRRTHHRNNITNLIKSSLSPLPCFKRRPQISRYQSAGLALSYCHFFLK